MDKFGSLYADKFSGENKK